MFKPLLILFILVLSYQAFCAGPKKDQIIDDYSVIQRLYFPVDEGVENEDKLINYLEKYLKSNNVAYSILGISDSDYASKSKNIEITFKSKIKTDEEIIIVCSLDSPIIKQEYYDNSISIQIALKLIKLFKDKANSKNITFLFTGANEKEIHNEFWGLKKYFNDKEDFSKSFVIFL